ncbi:MAG: Crp/Fnr family transcriptional regulator [Alphaproteobacteria bacterium]|nr:Crp/Fnr family transcriptional regulator [Alphaproteobacteria bacterium]
MFKSVTNLKTSDCGDCPIQASAVCSRCEPDELEALERLKTYKTYAAGQTIIWAGDELQFVGSVVKGVATLSQTMEDGRRQMVGLLLPSDFVGRPGRQHAPFDVIAATEVTLCRFHKADFENLIKTSTAVASRLLEMMLDELDAAREWMLLLGRKTAREKIASLIVIIARRDKSLGPFEGNSRIQFDLPLSREAMADYLGLTLETVSRQISSLKRDGFIELTGKRHIAIPDFARLENETGDDTDGGMLA